MGCVDVMEWILLPDGGGDGVGLVGGGEGDWDWGMGGGVGVRAGREGGAKGERGTGDGRREG